MPAALFATVGIPACGKSTLCRALVADGTVQGIVSSDDIRLEHDMPQGSPDCWPIVRGRTEGWMDAAGRVIVDATNLRPEYRAWLLEVGRSWGVKPVLCRVPVEFETALVRNAAREGFARVPHDVMLKFRDDWDAYCGTDILVAEGFTVITYDMETTP